MSYGMIIRNSDGALVVDSDFLNYAVIQNGTFSQSVGTSIAGDLVTFSSPVTTPEPPLVAAKWGPNSNLYCWGVKIFGAPGAWTGFQLLMQAIPAAGVVSIQYSVYLANPSVSGGFGMVVRNEVGRVAFDSKFEPLEVVDFLPPVGWILESSTLPLPGYRVATYTRVNPVPGSVMVLSTHRFGDLVYPNGIEGSTPVALASYGYGYGASGALRMIVTLDTGSSTVNPTAPSTPNAYVSALTFTGF